jgi:hypothetical protein
LNTNLLTEPSMDRPMGWFSGTRDNTKHRNLKVYRHSVQQCFPPQCRTESRIEKF